MKKKKKKEDFKGYSQRIIFPACHRITKEEVEAQVKTHSSWQLLNAINTSGNYTKKLLSIIPRETVSTILRVYRTINIFLKGKTYSEMSKKNKFPINDIKKIREILMKHTTKFKTVNGKLIVKRGWLEKEDVEACIMFISNKFWMPSNKTIKTLFAIGREKIKKQQRTTRPPNEPLNIVIFLLAEHLKAKNKKPQWVLICDFLLEQELIKDVNDVRWTKEVIRDRYRKNNPDKLKKQYEFYRELCLYPEQKIKRDIPLEQRQWLLSFSAYERDITLPPWPELLP